MQYYKLRIAFKNWDNTASNKEVVYQRVHDIEVDKDQLHFFWSPSDSRNFEMYVQMENVLYIQKAEWQE